MPDCQGAHVVLRGQRGGAGLSAEYQVMPLRSPARRLLTKTEPQGPKSPVLVREQKGFVASWMVKSMSVHLYAGPTKLWLKEQLAPHGEGASMIRFPYNVLYTKPVAVVVLLV